MRLARQQAGYLLEHAALAFIGFALLWKGGKGLEATWILGSLAVLMTFARFWLRTRDSQPVSRVPTDLWIALMAFLLWTVVSFVFSTAQNYGLDEVFRDGACILLFFWMVHALQKGGGPFIRRWISVIAVATIIACAVGIPVYILQPVNRFVGTFFDYRFTTDYWPNAWAEYLLLSWPLVVLSLRRFSAPVRCLVLGFVFSCLLLSYSRGALIAFVLQIGIWIVILGVQRVLSGSLMTELRKNAVRWSSIIVAIALVSLAMFSGVNAIRSQYHQVESVAAKATFTASEGSSSISERSDFWHQSFRLSLVRPFIGLGPYSFRFWQPGLQTKIFATSDHPHNVFLKLAMERGWPSVLLLLFILLRIFLPAVRSGLRPRRSDQPEDDLSALRMAALIAVTGVLAHNMIDFNLQFVGIVLPLWLLLAVLSPVRIISGTIRRCTSVTEILTALLLGCMLILEGRFLILSSLGRHAEAAGDTDSALGWYDQAHKEIFSRDMHLSRASLFLSQGDYAKADAAFDDYARVNETDARVWILRGHVALSAGRTQQALESYEAALKLGKYNYLEPLEGILKILSVGGPSDRVKNGKVDFLQIFHLFGEAILQNTHFIALSESVETFQRTGGLLQELYPEEKTNLAEFTKKVLDHAEEERSRSVSRTPGILW